MLLNEIIIINNKNRVQLKFSIKNLNYKKKKKKFCVKTKKQIIASGIKILAKKFNR